MSRASVLALVLAVPCVHRASGEMPPAFGSGSSRLDSRDFRVVDGPSRGSAVYYKVVEGPEGRMLRGQYRPGLQSVVLGAPVPKELRSRVRRVRWRWRARAFPAGGDECYGLGDSAASVFISFKRGLRWYILKYVWSPLSPLGATCDRKRSLFLHRDTIVLERDGPTDKWLSELVDVRQAFLDHFANGNPKADVPDLVGIGVMTDGDQTHSESGADWADFELEY
ncbi:MAG TPA: DUF3047 domain-containing protein [Anaeromyxobacteraceae bacterium]|nr:DUF3047 domain-containing protein [Anaeromyxobacteraceae bacterium]